MPRHLLPAVLAATALAVTGGTAFAIASSVSTSPDPLYISRTSPGGLSDHPDTTGPDRPAAARSATTTTDVTSTTAVTTSTTPATSTTSATTRPSTVATSTSSPDDHGGESGGHGSDDVAPDDHGGSGGHGSDDGGSDDHGGSSGHGSDD